MSFTYILSNLSIFLSVSVKYVQYVRTINIMKHLVFAFVVLVLALVISPRLWYHHLRQLPLYGKQHYTSKVPVQSMTPSQKDKSQPLHRLVNVWSPKDLESLRDFVRNGTFRTMPRNTANREREVRLPPSADGECPYEYLVKVEDACVPIGRLDSLLHLARFGGVEGYKVIPVEVLCTYTFR